MLKGGFFGEIEHMIKAIIFDLGDVVLKGRSENIYKDVIKHFTKTVGTDSDVFELAIKKHRDSLKKGRTSFIDLSKILNERLRLQLDIDVFIKKWSQCYLEISVLNEDLFGLIKKLKNGYKIGMISNIYDLTAEIDKKRGIFKFFDPCILSCEVGLSKPEKEIYELALKRLKFNAVDCVFIDNKLENLEEPKKLGFQVIHFQNNSQLFKELMALGVKA